MTRNKKLRYKLLFQRNYQTIFELYQKPTKLKIKYAPDLIILSCNLISVITLQKEEKLIASAKELSEFSFKVLTEMDCWKLAPY
ncbi:jg25390 [Pararge aegeria aegeria]|uniref:Jg25390 protein n=1 Tax=Pararge aegeria aegeria TaxID=348720 RepID=A0A8S4S2T6_9NEOP|nr:jg25390 [Pararge aegeria aegeria]